MKILWLSWKDITHPKSGGAEAVLHRLANQLVADGHQVTILTSSYPGAQPTQTLDGVQIVRVGDNRYTHSFIALWHYFKNLRGKFDLVIEVVNTAPYLSPFIKDTARRALFYHQLARKVWFYETQAPLSHIGYALLEPVCTFLLGQRRVPTVTVSQSTKRDLERFGFRRNDIQVIAQALQLQPLTNLQAVQKYKKPTILSHGALRAMKQTLDQVKAFEIAKKLIPNLQLVVSGDASDAYGKKVLAYIKTSRFAQDIHYKGRTTDAQKQELMQKSHFITVTSVKEGWGLIVTEAASQGCPAVVYNVDGLRDSVRQGETGIVTLPTPAGLAAGIVQGLGSSTVYNTMRAAAWQWATQLTPQNSYKDFVNALEIA